MKRRRFALHILAVYRVAETRRGLRSRRQLCKCQPALGFCG
jgi:hypothetical protein